MPDTDLAEAIRRMIAAAVNMAVNTVDDPRACLEERYGVDNVWNTQEFEKDFVVEGFAAPYVVVTRKSDGVRGSLMFCHDPRFYFNFKPA